MRALMLFLALFLTVMPDSFSVVNYSQAQEVCCEDLEDFEEEAVIKTVQEVQNLPLESSISFFQGICHSRSDIPEYHKVVLCFERFWLTHCRLRL